MIQEIQIRLPILKTEIKPNFSNTLLKAIRPSWFPWHNYRAVQREITAISPEELKNAIDSALLEENGMEAIDKLAELIPLEKLQEAVQTAYCAPIDALEKAQSMLSQAKHYFSQTEQCCSPTLRTRISSLIDALLSVLESIIGAFGIAEFFKPAENGIEADFKSGKIMQLLGFFSMLSTMLVPLLGAENIGLIIASVLLTIAALSLIYPYVKRRPVFLPLAENWSQQARNGDLKFAEGRKETLDEIANTLIASKEVKNHVMLIGKTGIGKTETARAFVHAVERGDYPDLKGKEIFYVNTADLVTNTEMFSRGNRILSRYSEIMGRHRENICLIFDEIHMACEKKDDSAMSEQLKTYLDYKKNNFPYVIGITTEEEYYREIYAKNPAFARRFKRIAIENTPSVETVEIINNAFLKSAPKVLLEPNISQRLVQKVTEEFGIDAPQPATTLKILSQCIEKTTETQKSPLEKQIQQIYCQIRSQNSQGAVGQGVGLIAYKNELKNLEAELLRLEQAFEAEKNEIQNFYKTRNRLAEVKMQTLRTVLKVSNATRNDLSRFLILSHLLAPLLETKIRNEAERLKLKTIIDEDLIDQVIREEKENSRKAQEMILLGKTQIAARI